jgi:hypothetical protein
MLFHDREVYGVTSRQAAISQDNFLRTLGYDLIDSQHLIYDAQQSVECGLDGIAAINRNVSMKDLLQHFGIGN